MKVVVEECEICGKREAFEGSHDDCDRFCRNCIGNMTDEELEDVCTYCAGCDNDPNY